MGMGPKVGGGGERRKVENVTTGVRFLRASPSHLQRAARLSTRTTDDGPMSDLNRDKRDLVNELTNLRKQVTDLKQAALERRRLEEGLRREEELLRALVESAPLRLCLLAPSGEALLANQSFARMLGYGSPGELIRLTRELGQSLVSAPPEECPATPLALKRKDGTDITVAVLRSGGGTAPMVLAVPEG